MTENGNQAHGRKVTRLPLDCGLIALIEPLPYFVLKGIRKRAFELHPDPDEKDYRLPFPESAIPDDYKPATENPVYVRLVNEASTRRNDYILWATVHLSVSFEEERDDLIARYTDQRHRAAQFTDLPEDAWDATVMCLIGSDDEMTVIYRIASDQEPLTQEEVRDGVRFFRRDLPKPTTRKLAGEPPSVS